MATPRKLEWQTSLGSAAQELKRLRLFTTRINELKERLKEAAAV